MNEHLDHRGEPTGGGYRDTTPLALLDTVRQDVRYAWRSFRRAPLAVVTIISTVGLGLGLVAAVFTLLNAFVFRADEVRDPNELFAIDRQRSGDDAPATFTRAELEALARDGTIFSEAFGMTLQLDAWVEGRRLEGYAVTGNFFDALGVGTERGRTLTPADDQPGQPAVMLLSHRAWVLYFASDPAILTRTVRVNGATFQVVGVTPEGFRGLEVVAPPDFWAPVSMISQFHQGREDAAALQIVGRLALGLSRAQALARLNVWDPLRASRGPDERPVASLVLEPRQGTVKLSTDTMLLFLPLFFAFGLILMIGCTNVANLLLARGVTRQREIGVRLAIGASRRRVVWQLLTESLLLALVCAVLAFAISRAVLVSIVYALMSTFPPDIGNLRIAVPPADWRVVLFLVTGAIVSTLMFALAPALQATRIELVRALRGEVMRDTRPGRTRDALLVLQVTGSVLLLICAVVFLRSSRAAAAVEPGIRTAGIVNVKVVNEERRRTILDLVKAEPSMSAIAASWPGFTAGLGGIDALAHTAGANAAVTFQFVSPEYFDIFGMSFVRGRGFTAAERSPDRAVAVVSQTVARQLWPTAEAVGQTIRVEPIVVATDPLRRSRSAVVVGVVRDVAGLRLGAARSGGAGVYMPIGSETAGTSLTLAVHGGAERGRRALVDRLAAVDPTMGEISTMETIARAEVYLLAIPLWLTLILGALALLLTLSGLFGVLSYLVEQRTREIGVRMALGASRLNIVTLILLQSSRPVGLGVCLGGATTAALGAALLATPAAAMIGSTVRVFDPQAYIAALLWVLTACACAALIPALRASKIDPAGALRQD